MARIQTYQQKLFDFSNINPKAVCEIDIAQSLSHLCRFNGHTEKFYSVAEHSVLVSLALEHKYPDDTELAFYGLMHDAQEAYVGDVATPLKSMLPDFRHLEQQVWDHAIAPRFNLPCTLPWQVKAADRRMLSTEVVQLLEQNPFGSDWQLSHEPYSIGEGIEVKALEPKVARNLFLARFNVLTEAREL